MAAKRKTTTVAQSLFDHRKVTPAQFSEINSRFHNLHRLPPEQTVAEWAEENIDLFTVPTPYPGRYSTALTPYVSGPLEAYRDNRVREITLCWGSQTAKTTTIMVGLSWMIANAPGPIVWVFPNEKLARTFSVNRWTALVNDNAALHNLLPTDARKVKILEQPFRNALLVFTGSNSPANLSSNPAPIVIMDEVDKLSEGSTREANAVQLAEQRAKFFWRNRKIVLTSTPTIPEAPIWERYLEGDQRRFFLACPQCKNEFLPILSKRKTVLELTGCESELTWDTEKRPDGETDYAHVRRTAHFPCPSCGFRIMDHHRTQILRNGTWRPTAEPKNEWQRSFHLSSLYAATIPAGDIAVDFLVKKASPDGLRGFMNGTLAEPWQDQDTINERTELIINLETDPPPGKPLARILTGDFQAKDNHWFVARDWFPGGHSRLAEWGTWSDFDDLEFLRERLGIAADLTGIDNGFDTANVNQSAFERGFRVMRGDDPEGWPKAIFRRIKGRKQKIGSTTLPFKITDRDPYLGTKRQGKKSLQEIRWSNPTIKDMLARFRDSERSPVRWEVPEQYANDEYFRHLNGEILETKYNKITGKTKRFWKHRHNRWPNHIFDCECEQIAFALALGILKLSAEQFAEIMAQMEAQAEQRTQTDDNDQEDKPPA